MAHWCMASVTENEILLGLHPYSRIVTPRAFTYIKCTDGLWYNWTNGIWGHPFNPLAGSAPFPAGSRAFAPNERDPTYVKKDSGVWLRTRLSNGPPSSSYQSGQTVVNQHGQGSAATTMQVLPQTAYHSGPIPANDLVVTFNVSMVFAENFQVENSSSRAFSGELMVREKASIRLGFPRIEATGYQARQHNLQRAHLPITRGDLAFLVAREVSIAMDALQRIGQPLRGPNGREVAFEDLILVDVKRVSRGSLQPTIAVYSA